MPCTFRHQKFSGSRGVITGDVVGHKNLLLEEELVPDLNRLNLLPTKSIAVKKIAFRKELKRIAKSWNKLKNDHETARKLRNLLVSDLTDEELDSHFREFAKPEIIDLINTVADIEKRKLIGIALLKKSCV